MGFWNLFRRSKNHDRSEHSDQGARDYLRSLVKDKKDTSFDGLVVEAKVVDVYDGDTLTVKFIYRGEITQSKVRMLGYDSPEMKPKKLGRTKDSLEREKKAAIAARNRLRDLCQDLVVVKFGLNDKYGRPLGTLHTLDGKLCINNIMLDEGHGYSYDGKTKQQWSN